MPPLKQLARQIFYETLAAIDIPATMQRKLQRKGAVLMFGETRIDLWNFEKLRVVAIGESGACDGGRLALVMTPFVKWKAWYPQRRRHGSRRRYEVLRGGASVPNAESWKAAEAIFGAAEALR